METLRRKVDVLAAHCAEVGRDMVGIKFTLTKHCLMRDDVAEAGRALGEALSASGKPYQLVPETDFIGPPERIAERWRPFLELGFTHLLDELAAPYDRETIEQLPEVRELVARC